MRNPDLDPLTAGAVDNPGASSTATTAPSMLLRRALAVASLLHLLRRFEAAISARTTITGQQAALVRDLLGRGDGVSVLIAAAGTGKGFVLGVAREAWQAEGHRVFGGSMSIFSKTLVCDA